MREQLSGGLTRNPGEYTNELSEFKKLKGVGFDFPEGK